MNIRVANRNLVSAFLLIITVGVAGFLFGDGRFCAVAAAEYLSAEQAGFRNCALIYYNPEYRADEFKPLLVKYVDGKPTAQQGYDAFLFLYYSVNGKKLEVAPTTLSDWLEFFDGWFLRQTDGRSINVPALNQAAGDLKRQRCLPNSDAFRIPVIFSISWLNNEVKDFGDVNQDGNSEDLSTPAGRRAVLDWYIQEITDRMKAYPNLRLWGFYMMREGLGSAREQSVGREYCQAIHDHGFKALWIPYYNAGGIQQGYDIGFDAIIMQSNWTFRTKSDGSGARRNQLVKAADFARRNGLGIELEINPPAQEQWREIYKRSLETGTQTGFQKAASATYFGSRFYWGASSEPADRGLYALWMDYLAGKPVQLPATGTWKQVAAQDYLKSGNNMVNGRLEYQYDFRNPTSIALLDLFLTESPDRFFAGTIEAFGRNSSGSKTSDPWVPLGWAYRCSFNNSQESNQNITVQTLFQPMRQLRVRLTPISGSAVGAIRSIEPDWWTPPQIVSLAYRKPYECSKRFVQADYPDATGRQLFDSVTDGGWSKFVGWSGQGRVQVSVDLGAVQQFDMVRLYLREEPSAGIHLPNAISVLYSLNPGQLLQGGLGALPSGYSGAGDFRYVTPAEEPKSSNPEPGNGSVADSGQTGQNKSRPVVPKTHISELKLNEPASARGLTFALDHSGWLFLSEIELHRQGQRLDASGFRYTFTPQIEGNRQNWEKYCDDGLCLTDGMATTDYTQKSVGVNGSETLTATIDLGSVEPIRRVVCYTVDGSNAGIVLPKSVTIRFSEDGETWSQPHSVTLPEPQKKTSNFLVLLPLDLPDPVFGRYVEVVAVPRLWAFLSEITVE